MFNITLLLGPVAFRDFEVPSGITFGGNQRLAVHRLAGGGRVIDALGRDDAQITFSGIFTGADATLRARILDELRASGQTLPLTWDVYFYTVIIAKFSATYENSAWIPYRLTCTVLRDEASALIQASVSLAADIIGDIVTAVGLGGAAGLDLTASQAAVSVPSATVRGTSAFISAQNTMNLDRGSLLQAIGSAETALGGSGLADATSAPAGVASLLGAVAASRELATLTAARGYLGRGQTNLANAST